MDSTYSTTKYDPPLYQLVVNTNRGYFPVAVIISQDGTKSALSEGLNMLKQWNPDVSPQCFITDDDESEIAAIQEVFPGMS